MAVQERTADLRVRFWTSYKDCVENHSAHRLHDPVGRQLQMRTAPETVSLAEGPLSSSLGLATEALAVAHHTRRRAREFGVGTWVDTRGGHDAAEG